MDRKYPLWIIILATTVIAALVSSLTVIGSRFVETGWRNEWPNFFAAWIAAAATIAAILIANWHVSRVELARLNARKRTLLRSLYEWCWVLGNQCWRHEVNLREALKNSTDKKANIFGILGLNGLTTTTSIEPVLSEAADIDPMVYRTVYFLLNTLQGVNRAHDYFLQHFDAIDEISLVKNCEESIRASVILRERAMRACLAVARHLPADTLEVELFNLTNDEQARLDAAIIESDVAKANPFILNIRSR